MPLPVGAILGLLGVGAAGAGIVLGRAVKARRGPPIGTTGDASGPSGDAPSAPAQTYSPLMGRIRSRIEGIIQTGGPVVYQVRGRYQLVGGDTPQTLAQAMGVPANVLRQWNPTVQWQPGDMITVIGATGRAGN